MDVYWENKGIDTLYAIQPQSNHFDGDILKNGGLVFVGEVQKPYHLTLTQEEFVP